MMHHGMCSLRAKPLGAHLCYMQHKDASVKQLSCSRAAHNAVLLDQQSAGSAAAACFTIMHACSMLSKCACVEQAQCAKHNSTPHHETGCRDPQGRHLAMYYTHGDALYEPVHRPPASKPRSALQQSILQSQQQLSAACATFCTTCNT